MKDHTKAWRTANPSKYLWGAAKVRARRNGIASEITPDDVHVPTRCPVFGMPLKQGDGSRQPHSPSIDRIDASKGYVKGNIDVISWRANDLKKDATADELVILAEYVRRRQC